MKKLFFDIETVPAGEENLAVLKKLHQRQAAKNAEKGKKTPAFAEFHQGTTFSGAFGRIVCLAFAVNDDPVMCLSGDEKDILTKFWELAKDTELFVGHNILEFDLRFIWQRSIVLRVKPSRPINFAKYRETEIFDTQQVWTKWAKNGESLETLAHAFGLPSPKEELDGSKVWEYFQAGKIDEICEYCKKDVEVNREVYKRMVFEGELEPHQAAVVAEEPEDEPF